jgi:hypothetical protein
VADGRAVVNRWPHSSGVCFWPDALMGVPSDFCLVEEPLAPWFHQLLASAAAVSDRAWVPIPVSMCCRSLCLSVSLSVRLCVAVLRTYSTAQVRSVPAAHRSEFENRTPLPPSLSLSLSFSLSFSLSLSLSHTQYCTMQVPVIQGSRDGETWYDYEWSDMICDVHRPPPFVAPRQPRVDYKMFYEALGMNADNFSAGLFQAHNPCAFAGGKTSFIDCLLARLLEGRSPEVEALFRTNPFAGRGKVSGSKGQPPSLVRMRVFLYEPCRRGSSQNESGAWWTRRDIGPQRPVMTLKDVPKIWADLLPEPEFWHWDHVYWRTRCAARVCSDATDVGLLVPRAVHLQRPRSCFVYDGTQLQEAVMEISEADVAAFWSTFVPLVPTPHNTYVTIPMII